MGMAEQKWHQRYAEGVVIGILSGGALLLIGYLYHISSRWFWPVFYGAIVACAVLLCCFVFLLVRRIPRVRVIPSTKNIENCVRAWLENHRFSVKNEPGDDYHFRFEITLDSGRQMTVFRSKKAFTEYVEIQAYLGMRKGDAELLDRFNSTEKQQMIFDMQLELARAKMGYAGLTMPPENFYLFRRVPILPGLTEFYFISMIGDIEAAINLVSLMFLKAKEKSDTRIGSTNPVMLPSASDVPRLEPPTA